MISTGSRIPAGRLRFERRLWGPQAWLSLVGHALLVVALVWRGQALLEAGGGGSGPRGGGGGEREVHFLTLPAAPPMVAVELPPPPRVALSDIPPLEPIPLEVARLAVSLPSGVVRPSAAGGPGSGGGTGGGAGAGAGTASGPGTGGEAGYIFPPNPRGVIVPPERVPKSARGRTYRATFWVGADGRVQRVEVNPEIRDAEYRQALYERLLDFSFYPARNRAGLAVPGVVPIDFAIP